MKIFLSYSHKDFKIADMVDSSLQSVGLTVVRDIRDLSPYNSLKKFMINSVELADKSILLISDSYLKSKNCMFEILEVVRHRKYEERVIPIVLSSASKIYTPEGIIAYVKYWSERSLLLKGELESVNWEENVDIVKQLSEYSEISKSIGNFCSTISDILAVSIEQLEKSNFKQLLNALGYETETGAAEMLNILYNSDIEDREVQSELFYEKYKSSKYVDYIKGYLADERKLYKKALSHYIKCIDKDSSFIQPKINLGNLYMVVFGRPELAEEQYKNALSIEASTKALNNLGILYHYYLDKPIEAEKSYLKVIENDPYYRHAYYNLGNFYRVVKKDFNQSKDYYQKAIEIDENYGRAFNGLGILNMSHFKDLDYALHCFQKALESDPNRLEYILNISEFYAYHGNNRNLAMFYYEHALLLYPQNKVLIDKFLSLLKKIDRKKYDLKVAEHKNVTMDNQKNEIDIEEVVFLKGEPIVEKMHSSEQRIIDYYNKR
jgi:tetratricopeptide (TPR) repeat protein